MLGRRPSPTNSRNAAPTRSIIAPLAAFIHGDRRQAMLARKRWLVMAALAVTAFGLSKVAPAKMGTTKAYVTNSLGDDITMIDLGTLKSVGTIKVGKRVHGVCAQADGQKLFTTIESE